MRLLRAALGPNSVYLPKLACAVTFALMVNTQTLVVPEQAFVQLTNVLPAGGVAVNVTTVPALNFAEQDATAVDSRYVASDRSSVGASDRQRELGRSAASSATATRGGGGGT